jgi:hypothetical protein
MFFHGKGLAKSKKLGRMLQSVGAPTWNNRFSYCISENFQKGIKNETFRTARRSVGPVLVRLRQKRRNCSCC